MARTLVAGVDTSTQSCKVLVLDADSGEVVREGRGAHPDGTEVDPQAWWSALGEALGGGLLDGVSAIGVGGQQHGMVTLDEVDAVVRPALLWNDTRSADAAADLVAELGGPRAWADAVGVVPVAAVTVAKVRWLAQHEPENLARVASVVLPHDWLTGMLLRHGAFAAGQPVSGGAELDGWVTDRGDASGTGYFSASTNTYRPDLMRLAAGREFAVPRVAEPGSIVGETPDGLAVSAGTGDNMAAGLGLGLATGDVAVSLGTSGTAFARSSTPCSDPSGAVMSFADAQGGFLPLVCTLNAARVLDAGAAMLGVDHGGLSSLALSAEPGSGGLTLLPYLDGERTPNLPEATGSLHGLTRANATPENLARAHVEGMLLGLADAVDALRAQRVDVRRVALIGGAARSDAVGRIAAEVFGVPVVVPDPAEYVAIGAARQAAWATSGASQAPDWAVAGAEVIEPSDTPATRDAVARLRESYAAARDRMYPEVAAADAS